MVYLIYLEEIQKVTEKEYPSLSDNIKTIENVKKYANFLIDRKKLCLK